VNSDFTVLITSSLSTAANIQRMPLGVNPEVYTWCRHSQSLVIFPEDGNGITIELAVLQAPEFQYAAEGVVLTEVVLARNIAFPTLAVQWSETGFPVYYFDEVGFTITPTLPNGLDMSSERGGIRADPVPGALTPQGDYIIKAQSKYDVAKSKQTQLKLSVEEPAQCSLASIKSTEALMTCTVHDANNLEMKAIYLLISPTSADPVEMLPSSFTCDGDAVQSGGSGIASEYTCSQTSDGRCCCWLYVDDAAAPEFNSSRIITAAAKKSACNWQNYQRYEVMTMASGNNLMSANAPSSVVWDILYEFTVPEKKEPTPITFDLAVQISYEDTCDPVKNGPEAEQACKDAMRDELVAMLGTPADMITVLDVQPR